MTARNTEPVAHLSSTPLAELMQSVTPSAVVDRRQYQDPIKCDEGTVWFDEYSMSDGTRYRELTGIPSNQTTDISVDIGTPWLTCEEGHNLRTLLRCMSVGMPGRLVGPPRIWVEGSNPVDSIKQSIKASRKISLAQEAYHFLTILDAHDKETTFKYSFEPDQSVYYGESFDAMCGFGIVAMSPLFGRTVHVAELVDPCLADETTIPELVSLSNVPKVLSEVKTLGALGLSVLLESRRRHYHRTLDLSLEYLIPALATWKPLSSGEAGKMAGAMAFDAAVAVTFYNRSVANQEDRYRKKLKNHRNVEYFEGEGGHLGLAMRESLFAPIGRLMVAQRQLQATGELDLSEIWQAQGLAA